MKKSKYIGQLFYKLIRHIFGETQWRQQAQQVGACASGEHVLFVDEAFAYGLLRYVEFDSYHQSAAAHVGDVGLRLLQVLEACHEILTRMAGVLHKVAALHDVKHGQCRGAGEMVAAEGGAELSVFWSELGGYQYGAHRETVGNALCHGDDVGAYAEPLVGEELA